MNAPTPQDLVGKCLSIARHAGDMLNLHFGEIVRKDGKSWGELALHIQAPWRIRRGNEILVGCRDRYNPVNEIEDWDAWYESPHPSREDSFWLSYLGRKDPVTNSFETDSNLVTVVSVAVTEIGELTVEFDDGSLLEVFPCGTDDEFWRLLWHQPGCDHHVVELSAEI